MKKVLIVDDAMFMRQSLRNMLEENGFEVVGEADNGAKGLEMYKELLPNIVTMDITMPIMDGIEALKSIKSYDSTAKIIMITALGQEDLVKAAILHGAIGFIIKPFQSDTVLKALSVF
ncbi:MAG: response regulator [Firmicutes bacterium HGW-Firmicutes-1]|jgi:two-component system chemotaxis response regulator CheY|nr:MAG: response regulator [Firmicutes bacterium HGW-Firmicutes-1]